MINDKPLGRVRAVAVAGFLFLLCLPAPPADAAIRGQKAFLDRCPNSDPAYATIRADFAIRRDGVLLGAIPCHEPVSALTAAEYTDELVLVQSLRVMYAMDRGMSGHLTWTNLTLYDWMKSKIRGFNISGSGSWCCASFPDGLYVNINKSDDSNRLFDKSWKGISGNIGLYAHEARHVDGFGHSSCCGISNGCDTTFNPANLSSYAVQWWLDKLWMDQTIDVGISCLTAAQQTNIFAWHASSLNYSIDRFCDTKPGSVTAPQPTTGIYCSLAAADLATAISIFQANGGGAAGSGVSDCTGNGTIDGRDLVCLYDVLYPSSSSVVQTSVLDLDRSGGVEPLSDGLLLLRRLFGFSGTTLTSGAVASGAGRTSGAEIQAYAELMGLAFDIDGDGMVQPLTDGLLVLRYAFGFRGSTLITGAIAAGASRTTVAQIETYIGSL